MKRRLEEYDQVLAENYAVATMFLSETAAVIVAGRLRPTDFANHQAKILFDAAMESMRVMGGAVDRPFVLSYLKEKGYLGSEIPSEAYVGKFISDCPSSTSATQYCDIVKQWSASRHRIKIAQEIIEIAQHSDVPHVQLHQKASEMLLDEQAGMAEANFAKEILSTDRSHIKGVPSFLNAYNERCSRGGLYPGKLHLLGAGSGYGKTTKLLQQALHTADRGGRVLFVTAEMAADEIAEKMRKQYTGYGDDEQFERTCAALSGHNYDSEKSLYQQRLQQLAGLDIELLDMHNGMAGEIDIMDALDWCRAKHRQQDANLVVIDYIQLFVDKRFTVHWEKNRAAGRRIWKASGDLALPFLCGGQLDEQATTPRRAHFEGSKFYYNDAASILHSVIVNDDNRMVEYMVCGKQRFGRRFVVELQFDRQTEKVVEVGGPMDAFPGK